MDGCRTGGRPGDMDGVGQSALARSDDPSPAGVNGRRDTHGEKVAHPGDMPSGMPGGAFSFGVSWASCSC